MRTIGILGYVNFRTMLLEMEDILKMDDKRNQHSSFQFRVSYYDGEHYLIKSEIQEIPMNGKFHTSRVVVEE